VGAPRTKGMMHQALTELGIKFKRSAKKEVREMLETESLRCARAKKKPARVRGEGGQQRTNPCHAPPHAAHLTTVPPLRALLPSYPPPLNRLYPEVFKSRK